MEKKLFQKIIATIRNTKEILFVNHVPLEKLSCPIKVISANLCHPWPHLKRGQDRLRQFIHLVQDHQADILLLQEVWQTRHQRVHEILSANLHMSAVYARTNGDRHQIGFEEGLAILSRYPLTPNGLKVFRSSIYPFARRQALAATVETPCGDLLAVSTHLSINPWRNRHQVKELIEWVEQLGPNGIIGGDFNAPESTDGIQRLKKRWQDVLRFIHPDHPDLSTHRISIPIWGELRQRLDYLFLYQREKSWRVLNAGKDGRYPFSDHTAVWAQLAV